MQPFDLRCEPTPNPNAMKFSLNREVVAGGRGQTFMSAHEAMSSPLARNLLGIPGIAGVFLLRDFVTVTRHPDADWPPIVAAVERALGEHFS